MHSAVHGETDDFSYNIVRDPVHLRDFQATVMHLLGINHDSYNGLIRAASLTLVAIIVIGNCSIPILVQAGVILPVGGA